MAISKFWTPSRCCRVSAQLPHSRTMASKSSNMFVNMIVFVCATIWLCSSTTMCSHATKYSTSTTGVGSVSVEQSSQRYSLADTLNQSANTTSSITIIGNIAATTFSNKNISHNPSLNGAMFSRQHRSNNPVNEFVVKNNSSLIKNRRSAHSPPAKRQILDDLLDENADVTMSHDELSLSATGGHSPSSSSSSSSIGAELPLQPANDEQPFATFVYSARINDKVQLPCDITPPTADDQMLLVLWYKDDQLSPILTLDGRKHSVKQQQQQSHQQQNSGAVISASTLQGRAYLNTETRPAHLMIDPVAASDEGEYRCRVDFRKARTVNTVISLKVITPPQVPKIVDAEGNALSGLVGPYNEGDELSLTCLTKGGKPRPSLLWWRDYAIMDDSFEFDDRDVTTNELVIGRLSRTYLLAILMCQAINSNLTNPASTSITLDMNLKPLEVRITQLTPILVAGSEALFECTTFGSRPMPIVYWLFDGKRYDTRIHGEQQTTSTLSLRLERHHRGAIVECVVENLRIAGSALRKELILDVQYAPQLELKLGAPSLSLDTVQEGIDIYFDCHIDANPAPTTPITWLFNGEPLQPEPGVIESNQSLVLQRVSRHRNGTYQCNCSNQQGASLSNPIGLEIKYAPVCRSPYTALYGVNMNEIVSIACEVDARPPKVSFQWRFERNINLANFVQVNDSKSVLEYLPRSREQFGLIECTAKNAIGIQREPCRYLVAPAAGPFFPYNCLVSNQSDSTLSIRCDSSVQLTNGSNDMPRSLYEHSTPTDNDNDDEFVGSSSSSSTSAGDTHNDANEPMSARKFHYHRTPSGANKQGGTFSSIKSGSSHHSSLSAASAAGGGATTLGTAGTNAGNLTTAAIYALYFSPEVSTSDEPTGLESDTGKLTYRNGGQSVQRQSKHLTVNQLSASASSMLMDLVPKFNSHELDSSEHLFMYPPTYYVCEIYTLGSLRPVLIKNITIDAVARRIMNPLNGSFSFLIDQLPPNTPLRVNIYAQNERRRAASALELDARTLRAAERRIDSASQEIGHARGRKSSFFEELYGGYGRLRSKHLIVGLLIGSIAVIVFVAVILIVMASIKSHNRHETPTILTAGSGIGCASTSVGGSGESEVDIALEDMNNKRKSMTYTRTGSLVMSGNSVKETTFTQSTPDVAKRSLQSGAFSGPPGGQPMYNEYKTAFSLLDTEDDVNSMRSDHQLLASHAHQQVSNKFYTNVLRPTQGTMQAPPSYYELEQSIASSLTDSPAPTSAYVNLIATTSGSEAKPDLIPNATSALYPASSAAATSVTLDGHIFDTVTFDARTNKPNSSTMIVTDATLQDGLFHFGSPLRSTTLQATDLATAIATQHHHQQHPQHHQHQQYATLHRISSGASGALYHASTNAQMFGSLPRNAGGSTAAMYLEQSLDLNDGQKHHQQGSAAAAAAQYILIQQLDSSASTSNATDNCHETNER